MRFLPMLLLLSPLTVACYDDTVDPTLSHNTAVSLSAARPKCTQEYGAYLALVGEARDFSGQVTSSVTSCTCEYTKNNNALGCRTDAYCESSYDIGAENPKSCTTESSIPEIEAITATPDRDDCTATVTAGSAGTFTGTLTCANEGPVTVRLVVTPANDVARADYINFDVLTVDAPCRDGGTDGA